MKWFKHDSDAREDIKLKRLKKKFGMVGIGTWWCLVETVAKEGIGGYLDFEKYPQTEMAEEWGLIPDILKGIIDFMGDIGLIDKNCLPKAVFIAILPDRADDFTKREERELNIKIQRKVRSKSEVSTTPTSATHTLIYYYINRYKEEIGIGYAPNWGRDGKLLKDLLLTYSADEIKEFINEFLESGKDPEVWWADKLSIPIMRSVIDQLIGRLRKKK